MLLEYPDILTTEDVRNILKVSKHTVYKYRIPKAELINFINAV